MILRLSLFLDASSDKYVEFWDHGLVEKTFQTQGEIKNKTVYINW